MCARGCRGEFASPPLEGPDRFPPTHPKILTIPSLRFRRRVLFFCMCMCAPRGQSMEHHPKACVKERMANDMVGHTFEKRAGHVQGHVWVFAHVAAGKCGSACGVELGSCPQKLAEKG